MNRAILEACLPSLLAILVAFVLLWAVLRFAKTQVQVSRLWTLHRCERGSVQSLSFVLTLPAFLMILLFIVQVSQLMVGIMVVHYSAYAGARAACVWIPAEMSSYEPENVFAVNAGEQPVIRGDSLFLHNGDNLENLNTTTANGSLKFNKIQQAIVLACAPISPSRDLTDRRQSVPQWVANAQSATARLYQQLAPATQNNSRIPIRLQTKLAYAYHNTQVIVEWKEGQHPEKDVETGPTYNPRGTVDPDVPPERTTEGEMGWYRQEVGWQDAVTVHVRHRFALLSGAGRFLAPWFVPSADRAARVYVDRQNYGEPVYSVEIPASYTMTNEGYKSVVPHAQYTSQ